MTTKADFTAEEWKVVLEGPTSAGLIVMMAQSGGTFRETWAMSKAYVEARQLHGESELLDEIVAAKPEMEHPHYQSQAELEQANLQHLRDAVELLQGKATPEELFDYRKFVLTLSEKVAAAHREAGQETSPAEQQALDKIAETLGTDAS